MDDPESLSEDKGYPLQIITVHDHHQFDLDEEILKKILFNENVKNKKVVVVSIAGAFRKGKSFLLNFFLKYLNSKGENEKNNAWLNEKDEPLTGFSWRGGSERETTGVLMWSKPFFKALPNGDEVAILLMDTQGAFDSQSTVKDCATVFALSTMLSSVQLFNLIQNVQEDDLQHLQLFTEYGRLASEDYNSKPFQHLMFLIRDWSYPYEYPYGLDGGNQLLKKRLEISDKQHSELQQIRQHIRTCFEKLDCFLLPHPGLNVSTSPQFDGRVKDVQDEFIKSVIELTPLIFAPQNLIVKKINGAEINGKQLYEYFKAYIKIYQGDELPEPKTMLLATAEANNLTALSSAKDRYVQLMDETCGSEHPFVNPALIERENAVSRQRALLLFRGTKKMGGPDFSRAYESKLETELADLFQNYCRNNEAKNLFSGARTPAVLFLLLLLVYVTSAALSICGLDRLATMLTYAMGLILISLVTWAYARMYGTLGEVAAGIDACADLMWSAVFCDLVSTFVQNPVLGQSLGLNTTTGKNQSSTLSSSTNSSVSLSSIDRGKVTTDNHSHKNGPQQRSKPEHDNVDLTNSSTSYHAAKRVLRETKSNHSKK